MTAVLFIYGFVGVIALISILNIINTMNTSIAAKTRYLGLMRAIGMSGPQL
jgi:putative ABC transport system permease protein